MEHSTLCPKCRHIMVKLDGFDGTSSADTPKFDRPDNHDFSHGGWSLALALAPFFWEMACDAARGVKSLWRKRRVKKLRDDVLPRFSKSLICPLCHEIVRRT